MQVSSHRCEQVSNAQVAVTSDDDCILLMSEVSIFLTQRLIGIDLNRLPYRKVPFHPVGSFLHELRSHSRSVLEMVRLSWPGTW